MTREVKLNELDVAFGGFSSQSTARRSPTNSTTWCFDTPTARILSDVLARVETQSFGDRDELENEIFNTLPVEAVGEPGQSEGEG